MQDSCVRGWRNGISDDTRRVCFLGPAFIEAGAGLIGGCCGSTPEHIRMLAEKVSGLTTKAPCNIHPIMLASERKSQEIALDGKFLVIGERINPTGKKKLQEELRAGKLDLVEAMAEQQEEMGHISLILIWEQTVLMKRR